MMTPVRYIRIVANFQSGRAESFEDRQQLGGRRAVLAAQAWHGMAATRVFLI